jgi:hypothetical protein
VPERDQLAEEAVEIDALLMFAKEAAARLVEFPGVHAVAITFAGEDDIPLGLIIKRKTVADMPAVLLLTNSLASHIERLSAEFLKGLYARHGQNGATVGKQGDPPRQPDGSDQSAGPKDQHDDQARPQGVGELDPNPDRGSGDR